MLKNITLSAEEELITTARRIANSQNKTLNAFFREWLEQLRAREMAATNYRVIMQNLEHVQSGHHYTRDELNER